jgi:LPS-assembly protein
MKNNFLIFIFTILANLPAFSEDYTFKTKNLQIDKDQEIIKSGEGMASSFDKQIQIRANEFLYSNKTRDLIAKGNGLAIIKSKEINIKFEEILINKDLEVVNFYGDILVLSLNDKFLINSQKIIYDNKNEIISSNSATILDEINQNFFEVEKLEFNLKNKVLKIKNLKLVDNKGNIFTMPLAFINTDSEKLIGKDFVLNLKKDENLINTDIDPRIKGRSINLENGKSSIEKGIFTTCKKGDSCPPWKLSAKKINHNNQNKIIELEDAILSLYNFPIIYFPKFFHPDPSVKRKSGFLVPSLNYSNKTSNVQIPYFYTISDSKDLTVSPRLYDNQEFIIQNEYRSVKKDSSHVYDFSFFNKKSNKQDGHIFYNFEKNLNFQNFNQSKINFKLQQSSNINYIKNKDITSAITNSKDFLINSVDLNLDNDSTKIKADLAIYENLSSDANNRYEYIYPRVDLTTKLNNNTVLNGDFNFASNNLLRSYDSNKYERYNINNIVFNSEKLFSKFGFENNYDFIIKNSNSFDKNNDGNKKKLYLAGLIQFNSSLPLVKKVNKYNNTLKPKFSFKFSPNNTKNISEENFNRISSEDLFNLDRIYSKKTLENGLSLALGNEYAIYNIDNSEKIFEIKTGNNIRLKENKDLPTNHQLGEKTSNLFNEIIYSPNKYLSLEYNSSIKNNFSDISYEDISSEIKFKKLNTKMSYINENESIEKNSFFEFSSTLKFKDSNSIKFSTRENKSLSFREYYNLVYEYTDDCLTASIVYDKSYYNDKDLQPEEKIMFKLSIIPNLNDQNIN